MVLETSIITTHSNINTSDIYIIFNNITPTILQEHSATILIYSFGIKFIVPFNLRLIYTFIY